MAAASEAVWRSISEIDDHETNSATFGLPPLGFGATSTTADDSLAALRSTLDDGSVSGRPLSHGRHQGGSHHSQLSAGSHANVGGAGQYVEYGCGLPNSLPRDYSRASSRGVSALSEACSVASTSSVASIEEAAFLTLGGGSMSSVSAMVRVPSPSSLAIPSACFDESPDACSHPTATQVRMARRPTGPLTEPLTQAGHGAHSFSETLLPRCSEVSSQPSPASTHRRLTSPTSDAPDDS